MQKYHKYFALFFSVAYGVIFKFFPLEKPVFRILVLILGIFLVGLFFYNQKFLKSINKYNFWATGLLPVFYLATFGVYFFLPTTYYFSNFFLIFVSFLGFILHLFLGHYSEPVFFTQHLVIGFAFFLTLSAANFYFPKWYLFNLLGVFCAVFFICRSFLEFTPHLSNTKTLVALVIGLLCVELFWAMSFLPLYFDTLAFSQFSFLYLFMLVSYYHLFNSLNSKKFFFYVSFVFITNIFVWLVAPWKILS